MAGTYSELREDLTDITTATLVQGRDCRNNGGFDLGLTGRT